MERFHDLTTRRFPRSLREAFPGDHYGTVEHHTAPKSSAWPLVFASLVAIVALGVAATGRAKGWW